MRAYALAAMLAKAESAILMDDTAAALAALHELQAHTQKLIGVLSSKSTDVESAVAAQVRKLSTSGEESWPQLILGMGS